MEMTDAPHITVLMPCRNAHGRFFVLAVRSVLRQSSPRWRLLVVDDGSDREETLAVLGGLRRRGDPRIGVVRAGAGSITRALNVGMGAATTPYVCTLHCDDLLTEDAIETVNAAIEGDPGAD